MEEYIKNPEKHGIPPWMLNRRLDPETGTGRHLIGSDLVFTKNMDINKLKRMKSYKGVRHGLGLPVRGQRTRSSGRTSGKSVGVVKKKEAPAKAGGAPGKK
ncbi:MAG TPA: 30S ribosomal protein S13 [archaeon]|nr:30S ribosomal protein S13 [archaeon]